MITFEICAFLETVGASALFVNPDPNTSHKVFVETDPGYDWSFGSALRLTQEAAAEIYDFVFVYYDEPAFAHYDLVCFLQMVVLGYCTIPLDARSCNPWIRRCVAKRTSNEIRVI